MGATTFHTYGFGRDLREAFKQAVESAYWEYGHGGYTGTIAEKHGAVLFRLPPRVRPDTFIRWIEIMSSASQLDWEREELARLQKERAKPGQGKVVQARRRQLAKFIKEVDREFAKVPAQHRALVQKAASVYEDKWGSAVALEITGTKARQIKERHGLKGTRKRVFLFCGWASC